jgi:hypothetical protein
LITNFLKTTRTKEELKTTLEVLREFKGNESQEEWLAIPFAAWIKLEQLEEFLAHLVDGAPLADDTRAYLKSVANRKRANARGNLPP